MPDYTLIQPTKRRGMNRNRATKIFTARNGICFCCRQQIKAGEQWIIEHPDPLALGGSDDDEDLWPAHERCRRVKDKKDRADIARRDRVVTKGWKRKPSRFAYSKDSPFKKKLDGSVVRR